METIDLFKKKPKVISSKVLALRVKKFFPSTLEKVRINYLYANYDYESIINKIRSLVTDYSRLNNIYLTDRICSRAVKYLKHFYDIRI